LRRPLVSVVLPTHDRVQLVRSAVASVLEQSERDLELIVVDDACADGTAAYLAELVRQDERVQVVRNSVSKGGAGARNVGISHSRGKWIAFLDDDDEWLPGKLLRQLEVLGANVAAVACSCSYVIRFPSGASKVVAVPTRVTLRQLLTDNHMGGASLCICASGTLKEIGGLDPAFRSAQDQDLWVRLRQKGDIVACSEPLVLFRAHRGARITNNMQSQYFGSKRFYFKHRHLMDVSIRRRRVAQTCFLMSRQVTRSLRHRIRYLVMSLHNSPPRVSLAYLRSSAPRLIADAIVTRPVHG
jgi:glycosyltransferase involved in cell wall biosynthesis